MNPQQRAEKIYKLMLNYVYEDKSRNSDQFKEDVAAEIESAVADAENETGDAIKRTYDEAFLDGKIIACEECAKVAETPYETGTTLHYEEGLCYDCDCHGECPQTFIAERIRARAKELK